MTIAEGSAATLRYKPYVSGDMDEDTIADRASDPGNSGGQLLRRVSANLKLDTNSTDSQEILPSRQIRSSRQTKKSVSGTINGEFSPGTYFELIEAVHRDTAASFVSKSNTEYTSLTADNATSKLTLGGGDPAGDGLTVGDIITISGASVAANNRQFMITAMAGTNGRQLTVYPAPTDMTADTSFGLARDGLASMIPALNFVKRKFLFERNNSDLDRSRLFEENRITGYRITIPAEGNATIEIMLMGRRRVTLSGGSAPFFASPTAITNTEVVNTLNGAVYLDGTRIGLVTSLTINVTLSAEAPSVQGQAFPPDILLGVATISAEIGFLLDANDTAASIHENETEVTVLGLLTAGDFATADAVSICLPRAKINSADEPMTGGGAQAVSCQAKVLEYVGAGLGIPATSIRIHDTAAS